MDIVRCMAELIKVYIMSDQKMRSISNLTINSIKNILTRYSPAVENDVGISPSGYYYRTKRKKRKLCDGDNSQTKNECIKAMLVTTKGHLPPSDHGYTQWYSDVITELPPSWLPPNATVPICDSDNVATVPICDSDNVATVPICDHSNNATVPICDSDNATLLICDNDNMTVPICK